MKLLKKLCIIIVLLLTLSLQTTHIYADAIPTPPTAPTAPSAPVSPAQPSQSPVQNQQTTQNQTTPIPTQTNQQDSSQDTPTPTPQSSQAHTQATPTPDPTQNASAASQNSDNGSSATNTNVSSTNVQNTQTQNNTVQVGNTVSQTTISGKNDASVNTGGPTVLSSGDANTSGTLINSTNTNLSDVSISQFTVNDNHTGDIVLDFAANCIFNCPAGNTAVNAGNGAGSSNTNQAALNVQNANFQTNDAAVGNNLMLVADSGRNTANDNTGGDTTLTTGNATVDANVVSLANNNLSGNIQVGVVNIYGNLQGDIILPDNALSCSSCSANTTAGNSDNGANSTNVATTNTTSQTDTTQQNNAAITNNLTYGATTGGNSADENTDGSANVQTGQASVDSHTLNIANSNVDGGTWWLVLVNKAGQWVGQILGAPDGSTMSGSSGTQFTIDAKGNVVATNTGNGAGSTNIATTTSNSQNTTSQSNTATLLNNINLLANTGGNSANDNTGGDTHIQTGNAQIIANLINFVNNNVTHGGKLLVTIVNVFGSWVGDFVTPGQHKASHQTQTASASNTTNASQPTQPTPPSSSTAPETNQSGSNGTEASSTPSSSTGTATNSQNSSSTNPVAVLAANNFTPFPPDTGFPGKTLTLNLAYLVLLFPLISGIVVLVKRIKFSKKKLS